MKKILILVALVASTGCFASGNGRGDKMKIGSGGNVTVNTSNGTYTVGSSKLSKMGQSKFDTSGFKQSHEKFSGNGERRQERK